MGVHASGSSSGDEDRAGPGGWDRPVSAPRTAATTACSPRAGQQDPLLRLLQVQRPVVDVQRGGQEVCGGGRQPTATRYQAARGAGASVYTAPGQEAGRGAALQTDGGTPRAQDSPPRLPARPHARRSRQPRRPSGHALSLHAVQQLQLQQHAHAPSGHCQPPHKQPSLTLHAVQQQLHAAVLEGGSHEDGHKLEAQHGAARCQRRKPVGCRRARSGLRAAWNPSGSQPRRAVVSGRQAGGRARGRGAALTGAPPRAAWAPRSAPPARSAPPPGTGEAARMAWVKPDPAACPAVHTHRPASCVAACLPASSPCVPMPEAAAAAPARPPPPRAPPAPHHPT